MSQRATSIFLPSFFFFFPSIFKRFNRAFRIRDIMGMGNIYEEWQGVEDARIARALEIRMRKSAWPPRISSEWPLNDSENDYVVWILQRDRERV